MPDVLQIQCCLQLVRPSILNTIEQGRAYNNLLLTAYTGIWWGGLTGDGELVDLDHEAALLIEGHWAALLVDLGAQEDAHVALALAGPRVLQRDAYGVRPVLQVRVARIHGAAGCA